MSTEDATKILRLIDTIESTNNSTEKHVLMEKFTNLTDIQYDVRSKEKVYEAIDKNNQRTSIYAKIAGLISFQNVLLVLLVIAVVIFIFSLISDLLFVFAIYIGWFVYKIFLTKESLYIQGGFLSFVTLYFKYDAISNPFLRYLFIFDWVTPVFGCIIFLAVTFSMWNDYFHKKDLKDAEPHNFLTFIIFVWSTVAIYHENWLVGIMVIMLIYFKFGFVFGSMPFGYYTGFKEEDVMERCFVVSLVMNATMLSAKIGFMTGDIVKYLAIFETGVFFWGSLVGSIALLIMSDEWYGIRRGNYSIQRYIFMQVIMACYCLTLMYFGNVFYITALQGIGGTFLGLWALDVERTILMKFSTGSKTMFWLVVAVTLYVVKQMISWYPQYFILTNF